MSNKRLVRDNAVRPTTDTIHWTQVFKCPWMCSEEYKVVDYYIDGVKSRKVYKVFVAKNISPPNEFHTSGYNGYLHFGTLTFGNNGLVFFVIHPNSWRPFQNRFITNTMTNFVNYGE